MTMNDAVKQILANAHAHVNDVLEKRDHVKGLHVQLVLCTEDGKRVQALTNSMADKAERMLENIQKATFMCSMLASMLDDRKERNAVVLHTVRMLADGHGALLEVQELLSKAIEA